MRQAILVVAIALGVGVGLPAAAQQPDAVSQTGRALGECFQRLSNDFQVRRATPERFQMAVSGACQVEEKAALDALEGYLKSIDEGHRDITEASMRTARERYAQQKQRIVSNYVVWYETSASN